MMPFEEKVWGNNRKRLFVCEWFFFSFSSVFLFFFSSSSNWDVPFERNEASCGACRRSSASAGLLCGRGFHFSFVIFFFGPGEVQSFVFSRWFVFRRRSGHSWSIAAKLLSMKNREFIRSRSIIVRVKNQSLICNYFRNQSRKKETQVRLG